MLYHFTVFLHIFCFKVVVSQDDSRLQYGDASSGTTRFHCLVWKWFHKWVEQRLDDFQIKFIVITLVFFVFYYGLLLIPVFVLVWKAIESPAQVPPVAPGNASHHTLSSRSALSYVTQRVWTNSKNNSKSKSKRKEGEGEFGHTPLLVAQSWNTL